MAERILLDLERRGHLPERPDLDDYLEFYYSAFFELDTDRYDPCQAIPFSAVVRYARIYRLDEDETQDLLFFIRRLDGVMIENRVNEIKKRVDRANTQKSTRTRKSN